jgi:hypothetical protein
MMMRRVLAFDEMIAEVDKGELARRLQEKLAQLVEAVSSTRKKGTLTIRLAFTTAKEIKHGLIVSGEVIAKVPEEPIGAAMFYVDGDGLSRTDPYQLAMEYANEPGRVITMTANRPAADLQIVSGEGSDDE